MAKIFITREIQVDSPLWQFQSLGHEVIGYSCITFGAVPFQLEEDTPWYFFYGKQGVRYFWQGLTPEQKEKVSQAKVGTVGTPTATFCKSLGLTVGFNGEPYPLESMSAEFAKVLGNEHVTIARGTTSQRRIESQLPHPQVHNLVVYENNKATDFPDPEAEILIFTSLLNVEAYVDRFPIRSDQRLIAIGDSTKNKLLEYGLESETPKISSEESICELLHQML